VSSTLVFLGMRWIMKQKKHYGLIVGILFLSVLSVLILTKDELLNHGQKNIEMSPKVDSIQEQDEVYEPKKEDRENCATDDYWKGVLQEIITGDCSYLEHNEQIPLLSMKNTIENDGFIYNFGEAKVSKKLPKGYVLAVDYGNHKIDENSTITNEYSYVILPVLIENRKEQKDSVGINNINILCFGEDAKLKDGLEIAGMKTKRNQRLKNFYIYDLEKGKNLKTGLMYIVPDELLTKKCGMVLKIDNSGVMAQSVADTCYVKIPIGRGEN
jgi:hypothetical protein